MNIFAKKAKFKYIPELDVNSDFDVPELDTFNVEHQLKEMKAMLVDLVNKKNDRVEQFGEKVLKAFKKAAEEFIPEELKSTTTSKESSQIQDMIIAAEARFASVEAENNDDEEYDEDENNY